MPQVVNEKLQYIRTVNKILNVIFQLYRHQSLHRYITSKYIYIYIGLKRIFLFLNLELPLFLFSVADDVSNLF